MALAGSITAAVQFGALKASVETATARMDTMLIIHENDQQHIIDDHREFRDRLTTLEADEKKEP